MASDIETLADGRLAITKEEQATHDRVVVFVGDSRSVWKDVRVGCITPRLFLFPQQLPYILERLLQ